MIPGPALSNPTITAPWLDPDGRNFTATLDYENGGIALNDPSQGLNYQVWQLRTEIIEEGEDEGLGIVWLSAPNTPEFIVFSGAQITEASLAFDQNMNLFISYAQGGEAKYYWFDTVAVDYVHSTLPAGSTPARACLDDKRELQTSASDIIMCYTRSENLYFRAQRDRYTIEYLLKEGIGSGRVMNIGMHERLRLQIMIGVFD